MTKNVVVMHDWDGTDVDTMPSHARLAAKVMNKHFGMKIKYARLNYLDTTGIPFDGQLEKIFSQSSKEERDACAQEYHTRKIDEVYAHPKTFPGLKRALKVSKEIGFISVISSSTEETLINPWVEKENFQQYFEMILGREHGSKRDHIKIIQKKYPNHAIFFLSDSVGDMNLPVITIGVCVPEEKQDEFYGAGADWVFSSPPSVEVIKKIQSTL